MGRHSAPDRDTERESATFGAAAGPEPAPGTTPGATTGAADSAAAAPSPDPAVDSQLPPGSRGDLQLLRTHPRLRASCAGAVVLSFALYTAVLIGLGRADVYPIWLWIPIVASGILVGALLDRAHRSLDHVR